MLNYIIFSFQNQKRFDLVKNTLNVKCNKTLKRFEYTVADYTTHNFVVSTTNNQIWVS